MNAAPFEAVTAYQDIPANSYVFNVSIAGATAPAYTASNTLLNVSAYTFLAYGATTTVGGLLMSDTVLTNIPPGNFALRLANASSTAGAIDVYLTAPGADLSTVSPFVTATTYQTDSAFVNVPLGTYQLRLTRTGTKEVIFDAPVPSFADGSGQTIVAYSRGSARLVNVLLLTSGGAATIINNRFAQLKALNATSVASPLNLFVDGGLTLANIPFTGVSNYQGVSAGKRAITVEAAATPGATLLATSPTLAAATDSSIALYGDAGAMGALVLADANVATISSKAQVRFVNVSPELGTIDAYANQVLAASGVAQFAASGYTLLDAAIAGTSYEFDFNVAGTATTVLTLPAVTLTAAGIYTIYVVGPRTALQGIVVQDF
jgi:hypothetical protein